MALSQAEFARQVGHSRQYINQLVKKGKLSTSGKGKLDEKKAYAEFQALGEVGREGTREWNRRQKSGAKNGHDKASSGNGDQGVPDDTVPQASEFSDPAVQEAQRVFNKSRAKEKAFNSLLKELDYYIRKGQYVPVSEVRGEAEQVIGALVSVLDSLPSRLAPKLIQRDSLPEVQQIIEDGVNEIKQAIQEEMQKLNTMQGDDKK